MCSRDLGLTLALFTTRARCVLILEYHRRAKAFILALNILFVHQNFPGQYIHIARALARQGGHQIVALGLNQKPNNIPEGVTYICYSINTINTTGIHKLVAETESKVIRGEACARAASQLKGQGFIPDVICAHPGWERRYFFQMSGRTHPYLHIKNFSTIHTGSILTLILNCNLVGRSISSQRYA